MANAFKIRVDGILKTIDLAKIVVKTDALKLVDINGTEIQVSQSIQSSSSDLNLANTLWIKQVDANKNRLMIGSKIILEYNPTSGNLILGSLLDDVMTYIDAGLATLEGELGTAAGLDAGTGAGQVVVLDENGKLPAIDASQLIGVGANPPGTLLKGFWSDAPAGTLKCNGAAVSRTTYANLFAVIGTTYGVGDGSTTFNLPELRGEFDRHLDDGRGVDAGRVLGSAQTQSIQAHTHSITTYQSQGGSSRVGTGSSTPEGSGVVTGSTGGTETRPRNIATLAVIVY